MIPFNESLLVLQSQNQRLSSTTGPIHGKIPFKTFLANGHSASSQLFLVTITWKKSQSDYKYHEFDKIPALLNECKAPAKPTNPLKFCKAVKQQLLLIYRILSSYRKKDSNKKKFITLFLPSRNKLTWRGDIFQAHCCQRTNMYRIFMAKPLQYCKVASN